MKKIFLAVTVLALFTFLITSCDKDKDCNCKTKIIENGTVTSETTQVKTTDGDCDDLDSKTTNGDTVTEIDCDD